jgi:hypothetical protein
MLTFIVLATLSTALAAPMYGSIDSHVRRALLDINGVADYD